MKGFAQGLVLKQRHVVTRKWPMECFVFYNDIKEPRHGLRILKSLAPIFQIRRL